MCTIFKNASPVGKKVVAIAGRKPYTVYCRPGRRRKKKKYGEPVPGFVFMSLFDFSFLLELRPWPVVPRRPWRRKQTNLEREWLMSTMVAKLKTPKQAKQLRFFITAFTS